MAKRSTRKGSKTFTLPSGEKIARTLPLLVTAEIVPFPSVVMSLYLKSQSGVQAVQEASGGDEYIAIALHQDIDVEEPKFAELSSMGVLGKVLRVVNLEDGTAKVLVQGVIRLQLQEEVDGADGYMQAAVEPCLPPKSLDISAEIEGIMNRIHENLRILVDNEYFPEEMLVVADNVEGPGELADVVAAHHQLEPEQGKPFLEELDIIKRVRMVDELLTESLNHHFITDRLRQEAQERLTGEQREYFLRTQMRLIRQELGEEQEDHEALDELYSALEKAKLPPKVRKEADKQLTRIERMPPESSEYALLRTYLEWIADLPWTKRSRERLSLEKADSILAEDHFGLDKVKERIIEYLSVRKLRRDPEGPILCFVGPPGVGKTSLGRSIAKATNREFVRISMGGVRDEAEIRGHRRTYVGALPGRIIQGVKQAGTKNPVFVLDELDKVGADFRGDPAAALLEVLDPHQNDEFVDHYLNVPFDLSQVMFIATANTVDTIPSALLDRLEVIDISGYTREEKFHIAERYLIPRQMEKNGLEEMTISFDQKALHTVIDRYTREAGVRNLEREIGTLFRKVAREYAQDDKVRKRITLDFVTRSLGPTRYDPEIVDNIDSVGLVRGLAWTRTGGELLPIEASVAPGNGRLTLTGQLGDVMKESGHAALFYARANAERLGLDPDFHTKYDIHIHVPDGATPKDGPSAGIALAAAMVSALSNKPISRDVAMTGEITLRGNVRRIGGLKEKALAALHYGIPRVIIPYENVKDLEEVPKEQRAQIKFIPVKHIGEVLEIVLGEPRREKRKTQSKVKKRTTKSKRSAQKKKTPSRTK